MKKWREDSDDASALRVTLAVALLFAVAVLFAFPFTASSLSNPEQTTGASGITVSLPIDTLDNQIPIGTVFLKPVTTTNIDPSLLYVGFQADFTFNENVITFSSPFVEPAGITATNWNVSGNILPGTGPIRILRVSAFSLDFTPLSGSGVLYNMRMLRVGGTGSTPLNWRPDPDYFFFIDDSFKTHVPTQTNGLITITGIPPSPTPTPAITPTPAPDTVYFVYQNFDHASPPALPFATSFTNGAANCTPTGTCALGTNWVASTVNPIEGPISAFHDAPGCVTDSVMETNSFFVYTNLDPVPVSFLQNFDLESGRDGGVLEIAYDGGCFVDIVQAGGSANYNGTISTGFLSPISGRNAWTGAGSGFGSASLPNSARGHTVKLRFRLATDCSGSGVGWRIDRVDIHGHISGGGTPAPTPTPSPTPSPGPTATPICSLVEAFNNTATLFTSGWIKQNNSTLNGPNDWSNGNSARFPAQAGGPTAYVAVSSITGCGTISNWLLTPAITLTNGGVLTFWTRTVDSPIRPDRLQVRMSTNGTSSNVGSGPTGIGDFATLLLDINPTYSTNGYPNVWTQYTITLSGLGPPVTGRLAFRYFVENGGPNGPNSDYIGIDTAQYSCLTSTPTPTPPTPTPTASATPSPTPNLPPCSFGKLNLFSLANFDNVTPPALPAGWTAMNAVGAAPAWVTSNMGNPSPVADTSPNSAFAPAPATISDNRLESQTISLFETFGVYVIFRHNFDLQSGFDGGVLEISFQGGPYQDVTTDGGHFVSGGYNSTISSSSGNPLAGRAAWSGNSGAFITSIVELPGLAANSSFKLRWRLGTDDSISGQGWRVDSVDLRYCHFMGTPPPLTPTPTPSPTPTPTATPPTPTPSSTPSPTPNLPPCSFGKLHLGSITNFDSVTPPTLPAGWTAMNAVGAAPAWVTSNMGNPSPIADTAPNSAFAPAPNTISDNRLESQTIGLFETFGVYLIFRHNFDLQSGFDGGVLEISFQGGPYQDVTLNGGQFVTGGYNSTISTSSGNPLAGRAAWSGNSGGFVTTIVELTPQSWNEPFKLRWRLGTDNNISGQGWRVDSVDLRYCHFMGTPPPTPTPTPTPCPPVGMNETFDDITTLVSRGWFMQNNSQPGPGTTGWFQGDSRVFPSFYSFPKTSYLAANFNNGTGTSTLSNWLLTPPLTLENGMLMTFWMKTVLTPSFPDRLQVRLSTNGTSTNVGTSATDVGDFSRLLLDTNPPIGWTPFTVTVTGLASSTTGRLALRYFVENGGPSGVNSDYIGIDQMQIAGPCPPTPTPTAFPTPTSSPPPPVRIEPGWGPFGSKIVGSSSPSIQLKISVTFPPVSVSLSDTTNFSITEDTCSSTLDGSCLVAVKFNPYTAGPKVASLTVHDSAAGVAVASLTGTGRPLTATPAPTPTPISSTPTATPPTPTPTPSPTLTPSEITRALNLSTRLRVETGNNVGIGGFIITGSAPKQVLIRGIGPSLVGISQPLADPVLELHGPNGFMTVTNNNWRDTQEAEIIATGIPPTNDLESAILATLDPGAYTAILSGHNNGTGTGLVEIYDLSQGKGSTLANISTRAFVSTGSDIVIAGFILGDGVNDDRILVRGIGPSLGPSGFTNALSNPVLELRNSDGAIVATNDDWQNGPPVSLPPSDPLESAIETTLSPGAYTSLLSGVNDGTGVALVEVYDLGAP